MRIFARTFAGSIAFAMLAMGPTGCSFQGSGGMNHSNGLSLQGRLHGGQQPVVGATIQLYTVGTTGDGSAATPLLTQTVMSDANGGFNLGGGIYSCTSATYVYLVATGGQPSPGVTNSNLAMMAALGPCTSLTSSTF